MHMDDYFYPYPIKGVDFPDNASFARYGGGFSNKAVQRMDDLMGDKAQETAGETVQETADRAKESQQQEMIIYDSHEFPVKGFMAVFTIIYTFFLHKKTYLGIGKQNELCYTQHVRRIYA